MSADGFGYASPSTTLWGWWNQSPVRYRDPSGHDGTTNNPVQNLLSSGFLPPSLSILGAGFQQQNTGYSQLSNDATVDQGLGNIACGGAKIAGGAGIVGADAAAIEGISGLVAGAAIAGVSTAADSAGNLSLAGAAIAESDPELEVLGESDVFFHYTDAAEEDFADGMWAGTAVTNEGDLTAADAMDALGLGSAPDKVIPVIDSGGMFSYGGTVGNAGRFGGGGQQWFASGPIPSQNILPAIPITRP